MLGRQKLPPGLAEKTLAQCKKVGLDELETKLLCDLLGWNFDFGKKDAPLPDSYVGLEPHSMVRAGDQAGSLESPDIIIGLAIQSLIEKLLGPDLMLSVRSEPIKVLGQLKLQRQEVMWLVVQLHLLEVCPEVASEVFSFCAMPLGEMAAKVVMPTLLRLLFEVARKV